MPINFSTKNRNALSSSCRYQVIDESDFKVKLGIKKEFFMDNDMSVNCVGLLIAHLLLIPHYVLMFLIVLVKLLQEKRNLFVKISIFTLLLLGSFFLIPVTFCIDFWCIAVAYSTRSLDEATAILFVEIPRQTLASSD